MASNQFMSLNMNVGVLLAMLVPLGGAVWTVSGWASNIEENIESNQEHIAELVVKMDEMAEHHGEVIEQQEEAAVLQVELIGTLNEMLEQMMED